MYSERKESCGKRIAQALSDKGMSQSELCKRAQVPKSSLSLYISGAYEPRQDRIYAMATVLEVDPAWLMGYDVPKNKDKNKKTTDNDGLSEAERELLELFNLVPEDKQKMVLQMIRVALNNQ